jgi:large subunit ribosomal protein L1
MGKIRTRLIGIEEVEKLQKMEQKERSAEKKAEKKKLKSEDADTKPENTENEEKDTKAVKKNKKQEEKVVEKRKRGKKYKEAVKQVDLKKQYDVEEAVELLKKISFAKFDESVELHINVLKEGLRGEIELPHSTGKTVRVAVVSDAVLEKLDKGVIDFDILISHPSFMPKLAKYARTLGPKGLMPNPKAGTISPTPEEAAKKFEKGTMRWKAEAKAPIIHQLVAKLSHEPTSITANVKAFLDAVGTKNVKAAFIKSSMSPALLEVH